MQRMWISRLLVIRVIVYLLVFLSVFFLFYKECTGAYPSDLHLQIEAAFDNSLSAYTLTKPLFRLLYPVSGYYGIASFLALCEIATIVVSEMLLCELMPGVKPSVVFGLAMACNFAIAIYIPFVYPLFNVGVSEGNEWHNATYTVMRLPALIAVWAYLRFDGRQRGKASLAYWLVFTLMAILATAIKPNFVLSFGPALAVFCLMDAMRNGKTAVYKGLLAALSMIIILFILWYQYSVLYTSDGESGISFGFAVVWRTWRDNILVAMMQSYAFVLLVLTGCWWRLKDCRTYRLAALVFIVALFEYLLISETGARATDGNFDWGLCFAMYFFVLVSVSVLFETKSASLPAFLMKDYAVCSAEPAATKCMQSTTASVAYCRVTLLVFALHVFSGVVYYIRLLLGMGFE